MAEPNKQAAQVFTSQASKTYLRDNCKSFARRDLHHVMRDKLGGFFALAKLILLLTHFMIRNWVAFTST